MSGSGRPTYKSVVQKDGRGLFVIYKGLGEELKARAPIVRGKVQTILKEGDEIRSVLHWLETSQALRVRGAAITHKTSLRKVRRQDDFGAYAQSPYEQWRVVKDIAAEEKDAATKIALANAKRLMSEEDLDVLGLSWQIKNEGI